MANDAQRNKVASKVADLKDDLETMVSKVADLSPFMNEMSENVFEAYLAFGSDLLKLQRRCEQLHQLLAGDGPKNGGEKE